MTFNSDGIKKARINLTAALRSASRMGLGEGVCNHFSLEVPDHPEHFLINPQGFHWSEITPSDLMIIDSKGNLIEGKHTVEPTAFFIHGRIHLRGRKKCVLHTHMPFATALCLLEEGKLEVRANQNSMRFFNRISYDRQYGGLALDENEGDRISAILGDKDIAFLEHHGVIVCGNDIAHAFDDLYYLERSCMVQVLAASTNKKIKLAKESLVSKVATQISSERQQSDLHFAALKRILDREQPGWNIF